MRNKMGRRRERERERQGCGKKADARPSRISQQRGTDESNENDDDDDNMARNVRAYAYFGTSNSLNVASRDVRSTLLSGGGGEGGGE